ncbi:hypothetical protein MIND_01349000 [Mycena indigotica]|uniref:Uncharacterized protein n=1 Tax=Mycena indigotica TaxID=2126181 RepID=A0A8H6VQA0_9AGAR|nr:uncharacterized protein MIND_01349000 [Mycena indigotica]KAF7289754.1 hypothetical protein MIND_01349000 [Mycena indigotica]
MPAALSSSPVTQRTTRNSNKTPLATPDAINSSPGSTPRRCSTCKQPRKGHPRSGCPFGPETGMTEKLGALDLSVVDDDDETEVEEGVPQGKERAKKSQRVAMPGTLGPVPSWVLSQSSCKSEDSISSLDVAPPTSQECPRPLTRTPSIVEREAFTSSLASLTKATIYVLPTEDAAEIALKASKRGLSTRQLGLDHADTLLLIGQTEAAVAVLEKQVQNKMHSLVPKNTQNGVIATATKGLIVGAVGAVAAWGALAFA